jgi:hypothetical protein
MDATSFNDLDDRISHRLDTVTPVDIREQLTFDDTCRIADGNELHGPPVLLPVDTVLDDHPGGQQWAIDSF